MVSSSPPKTFPCLCVWPSVMVWRCVVLLLAYPVCVLVCVDLIDRSPSADRGLLSPPRSSFIQGQLNGAPINGGICLPAIPHKSVPLINNSLGANRIIPQGPTPPAHPKFISSSDGQVELFQNKCVLQIKQYVMYTSWHAIQCKFIFIPLWVKYSIKKMAINKPQSYIDL